MLHDEVFYTKTNNVEYFNKKWEEKAFGLENELFNQKLFWEIIFSWLKRKFSVPFQFFQQNIRKLNIFSQLNTKISYEFISKALLFY